LSSSSSPIIPSYRGLTVVGRVIERDATGDMVHRVVSHTTHGPCEVTYRLLPAGTARQKR
jgi:hypothetical protein